jgi:hypothetical protein
MRQFPAYRVYHRSLWSVNVSFQRSLWLAVGSWVLVVGRLTHDPRHIVPSAKMIPVLFDSQRKVKSRPWKTAISRSFA